MPFAATVFVHVCVNTTSVLYRPSEFVIEMMEDENAAEGTWKEYERVSQDIRQLEIHLQPYCKYSFRVRAVNAIGTSNASQPSEPYSTPSASELIFLFYNDRKKHK